MPESLDAIVQYRDLGGPAAIDGYSPLALRDIAAECGIDTKEFFPVAMQIHGNDLSISIHVVKADVAGHTYEQIMEFAVRNRDLPITRFDTEKTLSQVIKHVKRLDVVLRSELIRDVERDGIEVRVTDAADIEGGKLLAARDV